MLAQVDSNGDGRIEYTEPSQRCQQLFLRVWYGDFRKDSELHTAWGCMRAFSEPGPMSAGKWSHVYGLSRRDFIRQPGRRLQFRVSGHLSGGFQDFCTDVVC